MGLFNYPILQAADILLYLADKVPVGEDQRQHLELTRVLAQRFNSRFGNTFVVPEPYIVKATAKIYDLQVVDKQMSKSLGGGGCVWMLDDPQVIEKKIRSGDRHVARSVADPDGKPGVTNLMTILSALGNRSMEQIERDFEGRGYGDLKKEVAEAVLETVVPFQSRGRTVGRPGRTRHRARTGPNEPVRCRHVRSRRCTTASGSSPPGEQSWHGRRVHHRCRHTRTRAVLRGAAGLAACIRRPVGVRDPTAHHPPPTDRRPGRGVAIGGGTRGGSGRRGEPFRVRLRHRIVPTGVAGGLRRAGRGDLVADVVEVCSDGSIAGRAHLPVPPARHRGSRSDDVLDRAFEQLADYAADFTVTAFSLYEHGADQVWRPRHSFPVGGLDSAIAVSTATSTATRTPADQTRADLDVAAGSSIAVRRHVLLHGGCRCRSSPVVCLDWQPPRSASPAGRWAPRLQAMRTPSRTGRWQPTPPGPPAEDDGYQLSSIPVGGSDDRVSRKRRNPP